MIDQPLEAALSAIAFDSIVTSEEQFCIAGQPMDVTSSSSGVSPESPFFDEDLLVASLHHALYEHYYARSTRSDRPSANKSADEFLQTLQDANAGRSAWSHGWMVQELLGDGRLVAAKAGLVQLFAPGSFVRASAPVLRESDMVSILWTAGTTGLQDGYYHALGTAIPDSINSVSSFRVYINAQAATAPTVVEAVTASLNASAVPFVLKCLSNPNHYDRVDPIVLYVGKRFHHVVLWTLAVVHRRADRGLAAQNPLFTRSLCDGIALAEQPARGDSFGANRCRPIAIGLVRAFRESDNTAEGRRRHVAAAYAESDIDLSHPYLISASRGDSYGMGQWTLPL